MSVISACIKGEMACASTADLLSLSVRHIKRFEERLREVGEAGSGQPRSAQPPTPVRNHLAGHPAPGALEVCRLRRSS